MSTRSDMPGISRRRFLQGLAGAGAAAALAGTLAEDGSWPSFLVTGWLGAAVLHGQGRLAESARRHRVRVLRHHLRRRRKLRPRLPHIERAWR